MSATVSTPTQQRWLTRLLSGQPHQVIEVPWNFVSIILSGSYFEETPGAQTRRRRAGQIAFRRATQIHRVTLPTAEDGTEKPCTSVVITGPWLRPWGFWCDGERFIPWQDFGPGGCGDQTPHEITAQKGHGNDA